MYEETAPPAPLAGVARCVWRSVSEEPKRIVPDGCLDLVAGDGAVFIAGPDTAAWSSVTSPGAELRGLRFGPGRAAAVLGVAADELRDRRVPLGDLWGRAGEVLAERMLSGEVTPAQAIAARLAAAAPPDPAVAALIARLDAGAARVTEAAETLRRPSADPARTAVFARQPANPARDTNAAEALRPPGANPVRTALRAQHAASPARSAVEPAKLSPGRTSPDPLGAERPGGPDLAAARVEDAGPLAVSERRLRRRFVQAVGYGPATYLRVSRFQRAVALAPHVPGLAALAAAAGYADQAHLSRECRALTGLTPRAYFRPHSTVDGGRLRSA